MNDNEEPETTQTKAANDLEKGLWLDPLRSNDRANRGAVLLAEDIRRYILDFNLLINKVDFIDGQKQGAKLKGASYTMTPHPTEAWKFERNSSGKISETLLQRETDSEGEYYIVPKNSLVFIKLRQELRVPFYMIGRHNLKIRYVYKGLLLGTGPQVDPGYVGSLIIPLHNFTAEDVFVYIEKSFVSIDFVRTTPFLDDTITVPEDIDQLYAKYEKEKCLIERDKVEKRKGLAKYVEGAKPLSQMGKFEYDFGKLEQDTKDELKRLDKFAKSVESSQSNFQLEFKRKWERNAKWKSIEVVAVLVVLTGVLNLYRLQERDTEGRGLELQRAMVVTNFADYDRRFSKEEGDIKAFVETNVVDVSARLHVLELILANITKSQQTGMTNRVPVLK